MQKTEITSTLQISYEESGSRDSENLILLLHGYAQSGRDILEQVGDVLPSDYHIVAPNALYPFYKINKKTKTPELKFSWYVFDPNLNEFIIDFKHTVNAVHNFLKETSLIKKNILVVGYSQGGYLSLLLSEQIPEFKKVIGLGCKYRTDLIKKAPTHTHFTSLHGTMDNIVDYETAKQSFIDLQSMGVKGEFIDIEKCGHRINTDMKNQLSLLFQDLP